MSIAMVTIIARARPEEPSESSLTSELFRENIREGCFYNQKIQEKITGQRVKRPVQPLGLM